MDTGIIISLILGGASVISSICFGVVPSIRKEKISKLNNKVFKMAKDINFFYCLEQNYIEELSKLTSTNKETIKKDNRYRIEKNIGYTLSQYSKPSTLKQVIQNGPI